MQLREALEILQQSAGLQSSFPVFLACGFTPLHFATYLSAHLQLLRTADRIELWTGRYGDLIAAVESIPSRKPQAAIIMLEWADLDPRLGFRQLGSWAPSALPSIVETVRERLERIQVLLADAVKTCRVVLCPPLFPLAPVSYTAPTQMNPHAGRLRAELFAFLSASAEAGVCVLDTEGLPSSDRYDFASQLSKDFPFQLAFAEKVAAFASKAILPAEPKKGLITDLDDTLWRGLVGEVGADALRWDLDGKAQVHGIYQNLLQSLAESGVLIAAASKNDLPNVQEAFQRTDLLLAADSIFPLEVSWAPKSEAVSRILEAWNVLPDSLVFVDDSPIELAEVAEAYPSITTLLFKPNDPSAVLQLIGQIRQLFGKERISAEDQLRMKSVRAAADRAGTMKSGGFQKAAFLAASEPVLSIVHPIEASDSRALELVNKTNQFNLNGQRRTESEWRSMLADPAGVSLVVAYEDKFGPLGKIAVLAGERAGSALRLHTWVMSCRAFSRDIEHKCLRYLFEELGFDRIEVDFVPTAKNSVIGQFLSQVELEKNTITRDSLAAVYPVPLNASNATP